MNRYEFALHVAENTGFTREQIEGVKPVMQLVLDKAEDQLVTLEDALARYKDDHKQVIEMAESVGVDRDLGMLAISLLVTQKSHEIFMKENIPERVFMDSMKNIRVWTNTYAENHDGKLGMNLYSFIHLNLRGTFLRHGRFEYCRMEHYQHEFEIQGHQVHKGDLIIDTHIPADGPMRPEDMLESFRLAHEYYKNGDISVFICHSWLLHPSIKEFCAPESNMRKFFDYFHIVHCSDNPKCADMKRVFGDSASYDHLEDLPERTSLQRSLKAYLLKGGVMGGAMGAFLYDGRTDTIIH
ncbi:MAG: DUF5596 domain-containing protein [Clostridia bacterium]|nr:DUF5596 domain-containing protein [Clostridia bacterium]